MTTLTEIKDKVTAAARAQGERYAGDEDRPLRGYLLTMATYAGLAGALGGAAKLTGSSSGTRGWNRPPRVSAPGSG